MKTLSLLAAVLALGMTLTAPDAEAARRLGGGTSSGMQRDMSSPAKAPAVAPTQAPTASAATKAPASAAAAPQAQPKRSWMGPLAGLAAGLGLAALASHLGFGEELASMLMIGLLVMAVMVAAGLIMRRRAAAHRPAMAAAGGMQYAAVRPTPDAGSVYGDARARPGKGSVVNPLTPDDAPPVSGSNIPADFDVAGFERQAKVNFIRLQAANDAGNLDDLREFTTPEMFAELKINLLGRGDTTQKTDVLEISAEVLEVVEEPSRYVLSVRYSGLMREDKDAPAESINEIWHLVKPRYGNGGWLLAGIQQMQ